MKKIKIYTDGSCLGNPGPGGWAYIIRFEGYEKIGFGGVCKSTNNQMELRAIIESIKALKRPCQIELYTDSKLMVQSINLWLEGWIKKDFKDKANVDLWKEYLSVRQPHKIELFHVRAHQGHEFNERCDDYARKAALRAKLEKAPFSDGVLKKLNSSNSDLDAFCEQKSLDFEEFIENDKLLQKDEKSKKNEKFSQNDKNLQKDENSLDFDNFSQKDENSLNFEDFSKKKPIFSKFDKNYKTSQNNPQTLEFNKKYKKLQKNSKSDKNHKNLQKNPKPLGFNEFANSYPKDGFLPKSGPLNWRKSEFEVLIPKDYPPISVLYESLGYVFKSEDALLQALTHKSSKKGPNNERLEFLGDAVFDLIVGEYLFFKYPKSDEGELSKLRASLVSENSLAKLANDCELGHYLFLSAAEEHNNGRKKPSILADAFEAIVGAIFLESGFEAVKKSSLFVLEKCYKDVDLWALVNDYKTRLQELTQGRFGKMPTYEFISSCGPDHKKEFEMAVCLDESEIARGHSTTKKKAEQLAAKKAIKLLFNEGSN